MIIVLENEFKRFRKIKMLKKIKEKEECKEKEEREVIDRYLNLFIKFKKYVVELKYLIYFLLIDLQIILKMIYV